MMIFPLYELYTDAFGVFVWVVIVVFFVALVAKLRGRG